MKFPYTASAFRLKEGDITTIGDHLPGTIHQINQIGDGFTILYTTGFAEYVPYFTEVKVIGIDKKHRK